MSNVKNVVLVHGAFADGSGWQRLYHLLTAEGFNVRIVQHPTVTFEDDVARTKRVIEAQDGPVVLVGHSYGGAVITEAGNHDNVVALVYVAAFAPDTGESVGSLSADPPPGAQAPPILPPQDGFLLLDRDGFSAAFAADLPAEEASFMADAQVPWGLGAVTGTVSDPAWRAKPTWYLIASDDGMIPPPAQRSMAERAGASVTEVAASHAVYISQPAAVAALVQEAARL